MLKPFLHSDKIARRRIVQIGLSLLFLPIMRVKAVWAATPVSARLGKHEDKTRLVLDLPKKYGYRLLPLKNPDRLVIDFDGKPVSVPALDIAPRGVVKAVRFGTSPSGGLRTVLDLTGPVSVAKEFTLNPQGGFGYRFVWDMKKTKTTDQTAPSMPIDPAAPAYSGALPTRKPFAEKPNRKAVIVLDPGHGGRDPGAVGVSGVYEKNITLAMARELRTQLEGTGKFKVILTRERDKTLSLGRRVRIARAANADLFVSLHADSIRKRSVRGLSVYTLSENASDKEAAGLAERENKADIIAGIDLSGEAPEVSNILIDLARRETMNLSARFAALTVKEMVKQVKLLRNSHRFAGFAVLKAPDIPSILIEMGYLSNKTEEKLLQRTAYRKKLGGAVRNAVSRYFENVKKVG